MMRERIGGYRLVRRLGSGGMADVYLAEQVSLGRPVAIKMLRPETLRHPGAVQRFEQEARAAASLDDGVAPDAGLEPEGAAGASAGATP